MRKIPETITEAKKQGYQINYFRAYNKGRRYERKKIILMLNKLIKRINEE